MWDIAEYERLAGIALAAVAAFVDESQRAGAPVGAPPPLGELIGTLRLRELTRGERLDADRFEPWLGDVLAHSVRLHHPHQIAHQVSAPDVPSAISDLVQGAINQPMSIYEMGPAAHAMERVVIEWMTEKVGWPAGAGGARGGRVRADRAGRARRGARALRGGRPPPDGTGGGRLCHQHRAPRRP